MNFTTQYNRAHLAVANPQLNSIPGELRAGKRHYSTYKNIQSYGNYPRPNIDNGPYAQKPPMSFNPQSKYYAHNRSVEPGDITNSRAADHYYPSSHAGHYNQSALKSSTEALPYIHHKEYTAHPYRQTNLDHNNYRGNHYEENAREFIDQKQLREQEYENSPNIRDNSNIQDPRRQSYEKNQAQTTHYPPPQKDIGNPEHIHNGVHDGTQTTMAKLQEPKMAWQSQEPDQHINRETQLGQEIARLQEELKKKEERLHRLQESPPKGTSVYTKINKNLFDMMQKEEQRKERSMVLGHQLREKEMFKKIEQQEKEVELAIRLEDLKRIKEEEVAARNEQVLKAQEYRESLEMQERLRKAINHPEMEEQDGTPKTDIKPHTHYIGKFTKKAPRTITFDPINGIVRDTCAYLTGDFQTANREKTNSVLSVYHNQYKIPPEFSNIPALQQPMYSKTHPKVMASFPITGTNFRLRNTEEIPKSRQKSDPKFRDYGSRLMKPEYRV